MESRTKKQLLSYACLTIYFLICVWFSVHMVALGLGRDTSGYIMILPFGILLFITLVALPSKYLIFNKEESDNSKRLIPKLIFILLLLLTISFFFTLDFYTAWACDSSLRTSSLLNGGSYDLDKKCAYLDAISKNDVSLCDSIPQGEYGNKYQRQNCYLKITNNYPPEEISAQ